MVDDVHMGAYEQVFHLEQTIPGKKDAASNNARDHYIICEEIVDLALDWVHSIWGFWSSTSLGLCLHSQSSSGWTMASVQAPVCHLPSTPVSTARVEPCRSSLTTHMTLEHFDCAFMVTTKPSMTYVATTWTWNSPHIPTQSSNWAD